MPLLEVAILTLSTYLQTHQGNAFLWSQFILGWVQWNSNLGSLDRRMEESESLIE